MATPLDQLKKAFSRLDSTSSGKLPCDALVYVLTHLDSSWSVKDLEELYVPFSCNGDVKYVPFLESLFSPNSSCNCIVPLTGTDIAVAATALAMSDNGNQTSAVISGISATAEAELRRVFDMCDVNKTGTIDKRELIKALRKHKEVAEFFRLPETIRQEDGSRDAMEAFFQGVDTNDDREMSWGELKNFWMKQRGSTAAATSAAEPAKSSSAGVAPSPPAAIEQPGVFMGTATEQQSVEKEFGVTFSADPQLWTESDFSSLVKGARYHVVTKCESTDEGLNKTLTEKLAAVCEFGHASYPEYFVPRKDFEGSRNPTGGLPPHHVWFVRGYVSKNTRVCEKVYADGSPSAFYLCTLVELFDRGSCGFGGRVKYRRPGSGFEFIVTVEPQELKALPAPEPQELKALPAPEPHELKKPQKKTEEKALWEKFHSAVRWGKPVGELEPFLVEDSSLVNSKDTKNGNHPIHISCQNGHFAITKWLVAEKKCDINAQNGKGQTGLHMSVEYDFMKQTKFLLDNGADKSVKNGDGNEAIMGIDGGKVDVEAWDSPLNMLKNAENKEELDAAYAALEGAVGKPNMPGKLVLAQQNGILKKKAALKPVWDADRFKAILGKAE